MKIVTPDEMAVMDKQTIDTLPITSLWKERGRDVMKSLLPSLPKHRRFWCFAARAITAATGR